MRIYLFPLKSKRDAYVPRIKVLFRDGGILYKGFKGNRPAPHNVRKLFMPTNELYDKPSLNNFIISLFDIKDLNTDKNGN